MGNNDKIRSQFCTCHDSSAVMACANFRPDWIFKISSLSAACNVCMSHGGEVSTFRHLDSFTVSCTALNVSSIRAVKQSVRHQQRCLLGPYESIFHITLCEGKNTNLMVSPPTGLMIMKTSYSGLILGLCPANDKWGYKVMPSLIGWAQA